MALFVPALCGRRMLAHMDEDLKRARWGAVLARTGAAGRTWRKSLTMRLAYQIPAAEALAADPAALKAAIKAQRRARAMDHWSFRPERLRALLALYVRALAVRRIGQRYAIAPGPPDKRRPH